MSISAPAVSEAAIGEIDGRSQRRVPPKRRIQSLADRIAQPEPR
ncbi:hypothetical protein WJT74_01860 [Sphingomicrobium sp. XHP0239]